jgi:type IV secretion system protein TrbJ
MVANAQQRWQNSVGAFEDSLKIQAGVVGNIPTNSSARSSSLNGAKDSISTSSATAVAFTRIWVPLAESR